ncbi:hect-domain-containing protein [Ophiostoma piceae UAMH 11346]|uniref:HECT-type E3 ubiquitin transferase n=1 Tax=Ophiostoma piceae (strain UAMH 11346) TaxID=1262450 RepID=S3BP24_OPHP1|nr:hect-domain-containing protein [Ophiostoma piceae UAMH 11346]
MAERTHLAKPRSRSVLHNDSPGRSLSTAPPPSSSPVATTPATARPSPSRPYSPPHPSDPAFASPSTAFLPSTALTVAPLPSRSSAAGVHSPTHLSQRITRASARQSANTPSVHPASPSALNTDASPASAVGHTQQSRPSRHSPSTSKTYTNKRKAVDNTHQPSIPSPRRSKRQRPTKSRSPAPASDPSPPPSASTRSRKGKSAAAMSSPGSGASPSGGPNKSQDKKSVLEMPNSEASSFDAGRHTAQRRRPSEDHDTIMTGTDDAENLTSSPRHAGYDLDAERADNDEGNADNDNDNDDDGEDDDGGDEEVDDDDDDGDEEEEEEDDDDDLRRYTGNAMGDPFSGGFGRVAGLPAALSMLGGMLSMTGIGGRLREILNNLRQHDDPTVQLISLQELSEILLVSNEDNLIGSFSPDPYVRELVTLMQPNEITGEENPEIMLLACRCLANLMEAIPASAANVVYGGAVPVLCQKLVDITFIDFAEQALITLEKISVEYPTSIVREGGLSACLSYLEFFATSTQRTAVTTAANCCRNIPLDSFSVVRDAMHILLNVLNSSDQRVVEQASLCVSRIVESFKHHPSKLEELVGVDLLKVILRLLLPGSSNHLIGPNLHTQFLRVLSITANNSPRLAAELFKMNVVETLYQILTGVSPPSGTENIAAKLDSVLIMQALIHRPREQVIETLNVVCNLLPVEVDVVPASLIPFNSTTLHTETGGSHGDGKQQAAPATRKKSTSNEKRLELLSGCKHEVRRFTLVLFPTLMDAYSSTVNHEVRLRVLAAQIKMLSNFDRDIILEALKAVPYASFLASILSQQDHPSLVISALQATELLMTRLGDVYRYQLYREGVINEIEKIVATMDKMKPENLTASKPGFNPPHAATGHDTHHAPPSEPVLLPDGHESNHSHGQKKDNSQLIHEHDASTHGSDGARSHAENDMEIEHEDPDNDVEDAESQRSSHRDDMEFDEDVEDRANSGHHHVDDEDENEDGDGHGEGNEEDEDHDLEARLERMAGSPTSSGNSTASDEPSSRRPFSTTPSQEDIVAIAQRFLNRHEAEKIDKEMRAQATETLSSLTQLAGDLSQFYLERQPTASVIEGGTDLFKRLATFFDSDVFESATSAELLGSGVVHVLERIFSNPDEDAATAAQSAFLQVFMGHLVKSQSNEAMVDSPITPFSILIHKLQDLLSRSEHFEVVTVHHNTFDGNQTSAASMLAKQIRLRLVAGDDSEVPRAFRSIMVSIHAIATFKTLEDYLRPRISLSDRAKSRADGLSKALAAMTGAGAGAGSSLGPFGASAAERLRGSRAFLGTAGGQSDLPDTPSEASGPPKSSASQRSQDNPQTPSPSSQLRSSRTSSKLKTPAHASQSSLSSSASAIQAAEEKKNTRRSSRRHPSSSKAGSTVQPPDEEDVLANALECADEKHLTDDNEDEVDMSEANAMDAVMGDLDEDVSDSETPNPAVNLEVATGGAITARQEDGTRVFTPSQSSSKAAPDSSLSALAAALQSAPSTPSAPGAPRPAPLATAVLSSSQDWHMEFSLDGKTIPMDSTVYRAVLNSIIGREEQGGRFVWSAVHTVNYRRVPGPNPPEPTGLGFPDNTNNDIESPDGGVTQGPLGKNPIALSILRLLKTLHDLNANVDDIFVANKDPIKLNAEPLLQFVNTKLTAKLNRQLEEPLIVASNCLPNWSEDLARLYPFLFPFETRHLFLQSTSFGYARSMARWQNAQIQEESRRERRDERPFLGRLQRQKVRISRSKILESAVKVMELYGASQSILEVEYFGEVGTGLGPTLEFYSTVSREFSKKKLKLWRDNDLGDSEFVSGANGLFPRPLSDEGATGVNGERIMSLFRALGKFVARSMLDSRIVDINFNPIFFRIGEESSGARSSLGAVKVVDPTLARSLLLIKKFASARKAIDEDPTRTAADKVQAIASITVNDMSIADLSLDFTLPGYPEVELVPGGSDISVNIDNVDLYIDNVIAMTLGGGVHRQVDAFRKGFSEVFPYPALSAFTPAELVSLFGRIEEDWSLETLMDSIKADHGFTMDSRNVKNLLQAMSEMTPSERRGFLQFTTGSPKLPIGGFRSLTPMFTVVCKPSEAPYVSDDYLPSVMTCVNYLKLPDYTSIEVLKKQLSTAIKEGQGAFHLS